MGFLVNFLFSNSIKLLLESWSRIKSFLEFITITLHSFSKDLKEFIHRSFLPNDIPINFQKIFYKNLGGLNNNLLLNDLKKLYTDKDSLKFIGKNCNVIVINSKKDLILDQDSSNKFIELLNKKLTQKPTVIELSNQGHCLTNLNFYQIITRTLNK